MNRKTMACTMAGVLLPVIGCAEEQLATRPLVAESSGILIACYSWSGNTAEIADEIQKRTGGRRFDIVPVKPYPREYRVCVEQAKKDIASAYRPELAEEVDDFDKYDTIFVGSPNWWGTIAPPVASFLAAHDFSGKNVIFFFTNGGGGMQNCEKDARKLCPGAEVAGAITFTGSASEGLDEWLKEVITIRPSAPAGGVLASRERSIVTAAAFAARGDQEGLRRTLISGLDAGVTINDFREILVQLYAYCGFPRSLNALGTLMAVVNERGNRDAIGEFPGAPPSGRSIDFGTANQSRLCGAPVTGALFEFAPAIDEYLKAHLFGDIFSRDNVDWKTRELATVAMLAAMDGVEPQLQAHLGIAGRNGATDDEIAEILAIVRDEVRGGSSTSPFPLGEPNRAYSAYFSGRSWLAPVATDERLGVPVSNVTFEPGCRNNWHKHSAGQLLIAVGGVGYYQERGGQARRLEPGDVVEIAPEVEHWHGAAPDRWFSHLAVECNSGQNQNTWLEPVSEQDYQQATQKEQHNDNQ